MNDIRIFVLGMPKIFSAFLLVFGISIFQTCLVKATEIKQVFHNQDVTLVLTHDGQLFGKGDNSFLHFANNSTPKVDQFEPFRLPNELKNRKIVQFHYAHSRFGADGHFLLDDGSLWEITFRSRGYLSVSEEVKRLWPKTGLFEPSNKRKIVQFSMEWGVGLAVLEDGKVLSRNTLGSLFYGAALGSNNKGVREKLSKILTNPFDKVVEASYGNTHSLVRTAEGGLRAFGANENNSLGLEARDPISSSLPLVIRTVERTQAVQVRAYYHTSATVLDNGKLPVFGGSPSMRCSPGSPMDKNAVVELPHGRKIVQVELNSNSMLMLAQDGTVWGCGRFIGKEVSVPTQLGWSQHADKKAVQIFANGKFTALLENDVIVSPTELSWENYAEVLSQMEQSSRIPMSMVAKFDRAEMNPEKPSSILK